MTTVAAPVSLASFTDVDSATGAAALVGALDQQAAVPAIQRLRSTAVEMAGVRMGHRVVDVGCGTGDLARALATMVGADGWVVGIDASETMLTEARRRIDAATLPLEFRAGDVTDLDDHDGGSRHGALNHPKLAVASDDRVCTATDSDRSRSIPDGRDSVVDQHLRGAAAQTTRGARRTARRSAPEASPRP
jgi:SAM-dependent methyltransferase